MKKRLIQGILLVSLATSAQANGLVSSFAQCDASFFKELHGKTLEPTRYFLESDNDISWFKVPDPMNPDKAKLIFDDGLKEEGLTIAGYYDSRIDLSRYDFEQFYFWGLYFNEPLERVKAVLADDQWITLEGDKNRYKRATLARNSQNEKWVEKEKDATKAKMEKNLYLQVDDERTLLLCTLEGYFTQEALWQDRPDLK